MRTTVFLCLACYDKQAETVLDAPAGAQRFNAVRLRAHLAGAMIVTGTLVAAVTVALDFLRVGVSAGFGWRQLLALIVGLGLAGCGMLFRAGAVAAVGGVIVLVACFADVLHLGRQLDTAWWQGVGTVLAAMLILAGSMVARNLTREEPGVRPR